MSFKLPKLFLDSGDPDETKKVKSILGFIDGQTTNPSLVVKNPAVQKYVQNGKKLTQDELMSIYKDIIYEIDKVVSGPISVETYADWNTKSEELLSQAHEMKKWGRNIYIKFPAIKEGLISANEFVKTGGKVNLTLVFDQNQAASVYFATLPTFTPAFVSPFVGRWDDRGYQGLDLIKNIRKMYDIFSKKRNEKSPHVKILSASIRNLNHFYGSIINGADIITAPTKIFEEWVKEGRKIPQENKIESNLNLKAIAYKEITPHDDFTKFITSVEPGSLLEEGLNKFISDWNGLL